MYFFLYIFFLQKYESSKKFGKYVLTKTKKNQPPRKFTNEVEKLTKEELKSNNSLQQKQLKQIIKDKTSTDISISCLSKHLSELGCYKLPTVVPILSEKNKEKRLQYALHYFFIENPLYFFL